MSKTVVLAFGRFNPPTIAHKALVLKMTSFGLPAKLYMSHSHDKSKNPLSFSDKYYWVNKAFGEYVEVVNSEAKTIINALQEIYQQSYTDVIYVGGGDRIGGVADITAMISRYNGLPDKAGNILYSFNSIRFVSVGDRDADSDDAIVGASASKARAFALTGDFQSFYEIVPFDAADSKELYNKLRVELSGAVLTEEENTDSKFTGLFSVDYSDKYGERRKYRQ